MTTPSSINNAPMFPIQTVNLDYSVSAVDMWNKVADSISDTPNQWFLLSIPRWKVEEIDIVVSRNLELDNSSRLQFIRYTNGIWFVRYGEQESGRQVSVVDRWNKLVEYDQEMAKTIEDRVRNQVAEDIRNRKQNSVVINLDKSNWGKTFSDGMEYAAKIALRIEG